jgi:hypothetical protein
MGVVEHAARLLSTASQQASRMFYICNLSPISRFSLNLMRMAREVIAITQSQEEEIWMLRSPATQFRFIKELSE